MRTREIQRILRDATPTLRDVAKMAGVSYSAMRSYRAGTRKVTAALLEALGTALIHQAAILARHGRSLRDEASKILKREYDQQLRDLRLGR
ncbi:MAG: hypothetical protein JSW43_05855 [Gemmatimonadota bacterium]|nr:MAG: hypothetical protein JSW43_05855 [Gemmatimonadota bacterium]